MQTAALGAASHLVNFKGTDTIAGIVMARYVTKWFFKNLTALLEYFIVQGLLQLSDGWLLYTSSRTQVNLSL